jgi:AWS domain
LFFHTPVVGNTMRLQRAVCRTLQADGCGEDCLNRHSYIHCDAKLCPAGAACSNRPFHQLRPPPMEVRSAQQQAPAACRGKFVGAAAVCVSCCRRATP